MTPETPKVPTSRTAETTKQHDLRHADLLLCGGTVLTPNGAERIDIACVQGRIMALGDLRPGWSADYVLDLTGLHVLPGVIDSQVHFREPGLEHKENLEAGTRGA
ncbi:MAG TPA: dihydroorotase, partial [Alcaligenes faecalis]|nr:dihydroorotase [Alcaligenes faecalis]